MAPSSYSCSLVPRFAVPRSPHLTGSSSNEDGARRQRERQKSSTFILAKQELFCKFFAVVARHVVKLDQWIYIKNVIVFGIS